jgi:ABC-type polysaccharide/polyol phosphate transport system ATPase subunit
MGVLVVNAIELNSVWVEYRRPEQAAGLRQRIAHSVSRQRPNAPVITAIADFSLDLSAGSRLGVVGPNGSGKSTLLAVMAGILTPTRGTAVTRGRVTALLGSPGLGLDPNMSGAENAVAVGMRLGETKHAMLARIDEIRDFSGLGIRFHDPVYTYSSGMNARLRFATITTVHPDILIIDEGIGAADESFAERAADRLQEFLSASSTLVMASHNLALLATFCDQRIQYVSQEIGFRSL